MNTYDNWNQVKADVFWGEVAPSDHILQIYDSEDVFIDTLSGFVGNGINAGDCCIVIATRAHLHALNRRLTIYGIRVDTLVDDHRYVLLDAEETLAKFMVNGWPDQKLFMQVFSDLLCDCRKNNRRIRAFGEMVVLLWEQGYKGATVELEHLWNKLAEKETFCLFCAYPKQSFSDDSKSASLHICNHHAKIISGSESQLTDIRYRDTAVA